MTTVVLNTVTRKVEVFSSARDVQARAEIADHKAAANPHPQYLTEADLAEVALSGDAGDLTAGTVPDARMPNWAGYNLASRTALEAASVPAAVVGLRLLGQAAVGDGGGAHYKRVASEPAHPHKIQSADGAWWEELFATDVTVSIPSAFATLQEAIDRLSKQPVRRGARIILNIESGHAPTTGLQIIGGDYSHFRITSTDPEVTVDPTFTGQLFYFENCRPPVLATVFDMNGQGGKGYEANQGCSAFIATGAGVKNAGSHGCEVRTSTIVAVNTVWTGAAQTAIRVQRAANADFGGADASNSGTSNGAPAVYASRGSMLNFSEGVCINSGNDGLLVRRSWVSAYEATIMNSGAAGIRVDQGGHVIMTGVGGATVTGSAIADLRVFDGSVIAINAAVTYGTTSQPINVLTGYGVIYNHSDPAVMYHMGNILDAVSQSAGVPTGGIIERGSNANGEYVKYADGTMICTHKLTGLGPVNIAHGSNYRSDPISWTFPVPFAAAPCVTAMPSDNASIMWAGANGAGSTTDHPNLLLWRSVGASATNVAMEVTATGRWFT